MERDEIINIITAAVTEAVEKVVPPTVERVVNGKIAKVQDTLENHMRVSNEHWLLTQTFMQDLKPVKDGLFTITSVKRFINWLGIPSFIAFVAWLITKN